MDIPQWDCRLAVRQWVEVPHPRRIQHERRGIAFGLRRDLDAGHAIASAPCAPDVVGIESRIPRSGATIVRTVRGIRIRLCGPFIRIFLCPAGTFIVIVRIISTRARDPSIPTID